MGHVGCLRRTLQAKHVCIPPTAAGTAVGTAPCDGVHSFALACTNAARSLPTKQQQKTKHRNGATLDGISSLATNARSASVYVFAFFFSDLFFNFFRLSLSAAQDLLFVHFCLFRAWSCHNLLDATDHSGVLHFLFFCLLNYTYEDGYASRHISVGWFSVFIAMSISLLYLLYLPKHLVRLTFECRSPSFG